MPPSMTYARYDLGQLVHYLRYGRSQPPALDALARSLGMHPSALRRYGRVTERIRVQEFASLLQRRDVYGRPLTWSHLEKLAEARAATVRRQLADEAVSGLLSVRAIARRVRVLAPSPNPPSIWSKAT